MDTSLRTMNNSLFEGKVTTTSNTNDRYIFLESRRTKKKMYAESYESDHIDILREQRTWKYIE